VTQRDQPDLDNLLQTLSEITVGATILGLRQVNINRRRFVESVPAAEPFVNAILDHIDATTPPISEAMGAVVTSVGKVVSGASGERLRDAGEMIGSMGPELIRLSGLTRHD
jgi:hypothetical protein